MARQTEASQRNDYELLPVLNALVYAALPAERMAKRLTNNIVFAMIAGVLAAVWLAYYLVSILHWDVGSAAALGVLLTLPSLLLIGFYRVLNAMNGLTHRLQGIADSIETETTGYPRAADDDKDAIATNRPGLSSLLRFGRSIVDVQSCGVAARPVLSALGPAVRLANKAFLLLTLLAAIGSFAVITLTMASWVSYAL
ncbi:MAG: hypothetical protein KGZ80_01665 [Methylomonas sp.]|nr:hypothetical protein [Methylomonas sp.]PPD22128.1 MAG: hypothetical protein CTY23_03495 [Methylomonas sp.]PPD24986.1 MAG: hypothetical protein CTY22_09985 [Methylomonas sp.]PPD34314.1 MAG: hypothetical protein CTY21_09965 [Methylomonas sp.]PPD40982.1 MAG: hypothetical protein CTY17_05050 [Methylomonas sp.]